MAMTDRASMMKIHMILAIFMLPAVLMFATTGGLYIWGKKGTYQTVTHGITLQTPLTDDLDALTALAQRELLARGIETPSGTPRVRKAGGSFQLEWTGADHDVVLEPGATPGTASMQVKQASLYQRLVQLHKAKGGVLFKIYATAFAIALVVLVLSGVLMAWQMPKYRRMVVASALLGAAIFAIEVSMS